MNVKVFGRCSGDQKNRIMNFLKSFKLNPNRTIAFVGDGTNDLQAIKNADTAIKLGSGDLSGSTAFSSESGDLRSLLVLISESKASLINGYHNFKFMIFFISIQFVGLVHLYIANVVYNSTQLTIIDFGLLNLFGFLVPTIQSKKRLSLNIPNKSIWHLKLAISLFVQIGAGALLMTYFYQVFTDSDFYINPLNIMTEEEIHHGHVDFGNRKFLDNHYLMMMVWGYSMIFLAVDNMGDEYRTGFFDSKSRTMTFLFVALLGLLLLITPILNVKDSNFLIIICYIFRIRVMFSNQHHIVLLSILLGSLICFLVVSVLVKLLWSVWEKKNENLEAYENAFEDDYMQCIDK
jgi:magnesium-transporting ATPase (P-type)